MNKSQTHIFWFVWLIAWLMLVSAIFLLVSDASAQEYDIGVETETFSVYTHDYGTVYFDAEPDFGVIAYAMVECESNNISSATNAYSGAMGLSQILPDSNMVNFVHSMGYTISDLYYPDVNMIVAHEWWKATGRTWGPWMSSYHCWKWAGGWK